jgi:hypothetical protein
MAVQTRQRVRAIGVPYETDPAKIADISSIGGAIKGLYGAGLGKVANTTVSAGRGIKNAVLDFTSIGSNVDKPFYAHWDPSLDPANAAAAPATVQAQGPKKTAIPSVVSEAQAAEIPKPLANVVQTSGIGALGGNPEVNAAVEKSAGTPPPSPAATSVPTAQPPKVQPIDGGSGYAVVDGKRINYRDIGASGDPLKKSGGYVMTNGKGVPAIDAPADPNIGAMDREVKRIQGVQDDLNLSGIGVMNPSAARQSIAFRQGQQDLDQRGDMVDIAAQREANDADYQNKTLAINAPLIEAKTKKELSDAAVNQFAISPEGTKQARAKEGAKDRKEAVNKYFNLFKDRALPQEWAGKHMDLAKKFAMADDPDNDYAIYFNPANPGRMGIGVSRTMFEPLINRYLQAGYPKADAMARAFGDLQRASQAKGIKLYEDIPNMDRFPKTANKPVDEQGV